MLSRVRLAPRFAVAQGLKADGSIKLRAVDHLSFSATTAGQKRSRQEVLQFYLIKIYQTQACSSHA
jgi:hypothetical protein